MAYHARLDDGTPIVFRLVRPDDKELFTRAFAELSDQSRYERFFTHLEKLSDKQLRYLTEVDYRDHSAWAAVVIEDGEEHGVGVGRWVRMKDDPAIAEVAVTVIDRFQGRGIGRSLLYVAAWGAREQGIDAFRAWILGENQATLRMLGLIGAKRGSWDGGVYEVTVPLEEVVGRSDLLPLELVPV